MGISVCPVPGVESFVARSDLKRVKGRERDRAYCAGCLGPANSGWITVQYCTVSSQHSSQSEYEGQGAGSRGQIGPNRRPMTFRPGK